MKRLILSALALCFAGGAHAQTISPVLGIPANLATFPAYANEASIRAAASAANVAGGGVVQIPAGDVVITSALPMYANVFYSGVGVGWSMQNHTVNGGTVIDCNGGNFNGFEYNPTDAANNATSPLTNEIKGGGVFSLGVKACAYGVRIGSKYNGGIHGLLMDNVVAVGNAQWGIWIENSHNAQIGSVVLFNNGVGQFAFGASGTTYWNYGNDTIASVIAQSASTVGLTNVRGVSIFGRASSGLNDVMVGHITSIGSGQSYSIVPTTTSGSPNLGVTDLSKFAVDVPVLFTGGASGFSANKTYIVVAVSGSSGAGTIQVALTRGGTAVNASATGSASTMYVKGGANIEFGAWDGSSNVANSTVGLTDTEAGGVADVYVQNSISSVINMGIVTQQTNANTLTVRGTGTVYNGTNKFYLAEQIPQYDADSPINRIEGYKPTTLINGVVGMYYDPTYQTLDLNLSSKHTRGELFMDDPSFAYNPLTLGAPLRWQSGWVADSVTWGSATGQVLTYTGSGGAGLTMPQITYALLGVPIYLTNPTASAWTITLNAANALDGGATTSFTVAANSTAVIEASSTAAPSGTTLTGTQYWAKLK